MKHHIIVKWNDSVADKGAIVKPVRELFSRSAEIGGVHGAEIYENCIARDNRYDIMIVIDMDRDALPAWDASDVHKTWKESYGAMIEKKAIFDCE